MGPTAAATLPILPFLDGIARTFAENHACVITAAPGAGKTTCVPPLLLDRIDGELLLLEPRRVATRAAAARISSLRGGAVGGETGYRVRGESRVSAGTRLTVMTPGVLLRRLRDDPALAGVSAVIFDEFHERAVESDLAFALVLDLVRVLRPELKVVVMSATLDSARLADALGGAPVIELPGRLHPVEIRWSDRPSLPASLAADAARAILELRREHPEGDLLAFLPGVAEIEELRARLSGALPGKDLLLPFHGSLPFREQNRALEPAPPGFRKVILATNIAESSLTIDGVTLAVDSGYERRLRYSPSTGFPTFETVKISRASAEQRAGRAGRTAPGIVVRLWNELDHRARPEFTAPEIRECDLAPAALDVALWGTPPEELPWFEAPPAAAWNRATELLLRLGALDAEGKTTRHGRELARLPLHPRLAAMLLCAEKEGSLDTALDLAAILEEQEGDRRGGAADLRAERNRFRTRPDRFPRRRELRRRLAALFPGIRNSSDDAEGRLLAAAFPEWVGKRRGEHDTVYRLAGGGAAELDPGDDLRREEFLAVARLDTAGGPNGRIRLAAPLRRTDAEELFADAITEKLRIDFDPAAERAGAWKERRLGAILLSSTPVPAPPEELARAVCRAALDRGIALPPPGPADPARRLLDRMRFALKRQPERFANRGFSPETEPELFERIASGSRVRTFADLDRVPWLEGLRRELGHALLADLDRAAPAVWRIPGGRELRIDYSGELPTVAVRAQELYGIDRHPSAAGMPLRIELLSPALRPVQIVTDLPGFWRGTWSLVRKEMRGRYPKHDWPEHPESASPPARKPPHR